MELKQIQKTGKPCPQCGEIMPVELLEDCAMCPECEVENGAMDLDLYS